MTLKHLFCIIFVATSLMIPKAHAEWRQYVGIHYSGFERYNFCECGSQSCWWLEPIDEAETQLLNFERQIWSTRENATSSDGELSSLPDTANDFADTLRIYIEAEGFLSPPGEYGHLGASEHQLWIRNVTEVREATEEDIQQCH